MESRIWYFKMKERLLDILSFSSDAWFHEVKLLSPTWICKSNVRLLILTRRSLESQAVQLGIHRGGSNRLMGFGTEARLCEGGESGID